MTRLFSVLVLVSMLGACAAQPVPVEASSALINFADIANEITVDYQTLDGPVDGLANNKKSGNSDALSVSGTL